MGFIICIGIFAIVMVLIKLIDHFIESKSDESDIVDEVDEDNDEE